VLTYPCIALSLNWDSRCQSSGMTQIKLNDPRVYNPHSKGNICQSNLFKSFFASMGSKSVSCSWYATRPTETSTPSSNLATSSWDDPGESEAASLWIEDDERLSKTSGFSVMVAINVGERRRGWLVVEDATEVDL